MMLQVVQLPEVITLLHTLLALVLIDEVAQPADGPQGVLHPVIVHLAARQLFKRAAPGYRHEPAGLAIEPLAQASVEPTVGIGCFNQRIIVFRQPL